MIKKISQIANDLFNTTADYKRDLSSLLSNKYLLIATFITIALGYGFALANPSVGIDDTASFRYFEGGELLAQGRFFPIILSQLLGGITFTPFWLEFISIILIIFAGFLYLCLFKKVTKGKLGKIAYILFIPIFISYPLINEIFIYNTAVISIGIGYLFTAIATLCVYEFVNNKKQVWALLVVAAILMIAVVSTYESFVSVFILGLAMILFLDNLYNYKDVGFEKKKWVKYSLFFLAVVIVAITIEYIVTNIYIDMHHIVRSTNAATGILWFRSDGLLNNVRPFLDSLKASFILPAYEYVSIISIQVATVLLAVFATIRSFARKNCWLLLLASLLVVSIFSLSLVQGVASPYRVCQSFALFVAFVAIVVYDQTPKNIKPLVLVAAIYLVTIQTYDLTKWFYNDNLRYQEERTTMITVAETIKRDFDVTKPVVFVGEYRPGSNITRNQTNGQSLINWGMVAFGESEPNIELFNFLQMNGQYLSRPTIEQFKSVQDSAKTMSRWPQKGSITELEGIIVVRF